MQVWAQNLYITYTIHRLYSTFCGYSTFSTTTITQDSISSKAAKLHIIYNTIQQCYRVVLLYCFSLDKFKTNVCSKKLVQSTTVEPVERNPPTFPSALVSHFGCPLSNLLLYFSTYSTSQVNFKTWLHCLRGHPLDVFLWFPLRNNQIFFA